MWQIKVATPMIPKQIVPVIEVIGFTPRVVVIEGVI